MMLKHSTKTLPILLIIFSIFTSCQEQQVVSKVLEPVGLKLDSFTISTIDTITSFDIVTKRSDMKIVKQNEVIYNIPHYLPTISSCSSSLALRDRYQCSNKALMNFVRKHISYPSEAMENNIQGVCMVKFVIDEKGVLDKYEIAESIGYGTDEVVLDMMKKLQDSDIAWDPGYARGKAVKVQHTLPVNFRF